MTNNNEFNIDIVEIFNFLFSKKLLIVAVITIFSIASVFYSLSIPNQYTSQALLTINDEESKSSSVLDQYSGLASMAGISVPGTSSDSKAYRALATIKSKDFLKVLIDSDDSLLPAIMAIKSYDKESRKIIYDDSQYNSDKNIWIRDVEYPLNTKPTYIEAHEHYLSLIVTEIDQITKYIKISVSHQSPLFSQKLLSLIINKTNEISKTEDLRNAEKSLSFLGEEDSRSSILSIKKSISGLMESQMKIKMLANVSDDYLLKIIDSPYIPLKKSSPNRAVICILGFFFGLFIAVAYLVIIFFTKENQK